SERFVPPTATMSAAPSPVTSPTAMAVAEETVTDCACVSETLRYCRRSSASATGASSNDRSFQRRRNFAVGMSHSSTKTNEGEDAPTIPAAVQPTQRNSRSAQGALAAQQRLHVFSG